MKKRFIGLFFVFVCTCCLLLSGCNSTPAEYDINVLVNGANFGTVEDVSGTYAEGSNITITAKPKSGENFFCWLHNSKVVSTKAEYSFTVSNESSGTYIALFECPDLEYIFLKEFSFINLIPQSDGIAEQVLTELSISFGYTPTDFYNVYVCSEEDLTTQETFIITEEVLYPNETTPFAFDKTKDIYVKIITKYTSTAGEVIDNYQSETIYMINKTAVGSPFNNIENLQLNKNVNLDNENSFLEKEDIKNSITINFKNLSEFIQQTEPEEQK